MQMNAVLWMGLTAVLRREERDDDPDHRHKPCRTQIAERKEKMTFSMPQKDREVMRNVS